MKALAAVAFLSAGASAHGIEPGQGVVQQRGAEVRLMVALPVESVPVLAGVDDDRNGEVTGDEVHRHRAEVMASIRQLVKTEPSGEETLLDIGAPAAGAAHRYLRITWHQRFAEPPAALAVHTPTPVWLEVSAQGQPPVWKQVDSTHPQLWGSQETPRWLGAVALVAVGVLIAGTRRRAALALAALVGCSSQPARDAGCPGGAVTTSTPRPSPAGASLTARVCTRTSAQMACEAGAARQFDSAVDGGARVFQANGLPDHDVGDFPNPENPNRITPQRYDLTVSARPALSAQTTEARIFGIAFSGAVFDPGTAELWNNSPVWRYEALRYDAAPRYDASDMAMHPMGLGVDCNYAHVQPGGQYHYHGVPTALLPSQPEVRQVGWAADGFPILVRYGMGVDGGLTSVRSGYRLRTGARPVDGPPGDYDGTFVQDWEWQPGVGDLDECNGMTGAVSIDGQMVQTYGYYITDGFPFIPRCWKGTPDPSFIALAAGQMMMPLPRCNAMLRERCCGDNVCGGPETPVSCPEDCR
jgi:hypothetical protein